MKLRYGEVDMSSDNCVAFQWDVSFDSTRRIGALTTYGGYQPDTEGHVKMNLDNLPSNFLRDYELDRFIYHPETEEQPESVEEDRYFDGYMEEKKRLEKENKPEDEAKEETAEEKENRELKETVARLEKQMEELLNAMKGGA